RPRRRRRDPRGPARRPRRRPRDGRGRPPVDARGLDLGGPRRAPPRARGRL
ncbi:MAG: hypothetical protein AVDCRST_MAG54-4505, partial [uncultured Actinomycetospora sp.]